MQSRQSPASPWTFFALVYALSVPLWVLSRHLNGGVLPDRLPVTDAVATFLPAIAASALVFRQRGYAGVRQLLARALDYDQQRNVRCLIVAVLLMPLLYLGTYAVMRVAGMPVPDEWHAKPQDLLVFAAFLIAAAGEELGYTGYATDPLLRRYGALHAALILGTIHAVGTTRQRFNSGRRHFSCSGVRFSRSRCV
jgi:hypothetical protein